MVCFGEYLVLLVGVYVPVSRVGVDVDRASFVDGVGWVGCEVYDFICVEIKPDSFSELVLICNVFGGDFDVRFRGVRQVVWFDCEIDVSGAISTVQS